MGWPPEDPDMWAVEARFKSKGKKKEPDIKRTRGLDYLTDWNINVIPHLQDGLTEAFECKDEGGKVIGWDLSRRAFPARF